MKPPPLGLTTLGSMSQVISGDTIEVLIDSQPFTIRFLDCWADSETVINSRCQETKRHLAELAYHGQQLVVYIATRNDLSAIQILQKGFGHGVVWPKGSSTSLGEALVKNGFAQRLAVEAALDDVQT